MAEYRSSGKELRRSPKGVIAGVIAVILTGCGIFGIYKIHSGMGSLLPDPSLVQSQAEVNLAGEDSQEEEEEEDPLRYENWNIAANYVNKGALVLVSSDFPLEAYEDWLVRAADEQNEYLNVADGNIRLRKEAMTQLNQLAAGFCKANEQTALTISRGYRSDEEQRALYDAENSPEYDFPGCNEMQSGYALELRVPDGWGGTKELDEEDELTIWLTEHCAEYGFILRFPPEKSPQTGVEGMEWVFRYVGIPHALYMQQQKLCLEEYLELLEGFPQDGDHLALKDALGREYMAYYYSVDLTSDSPTVALPVPAEQRYTVSGNNKHGLIVTVEMPKKETSWGSSGAGAENTSTDFTETTETTTTTALMQ